MNWDRLGIQKTDLIHFIGIGGIGMSGLAMLLQDEGFAISGSDISTNINIQKLQQNQASCFIGHSIKNILNAKIVVYSSIIHAENIELIEARRRKLIILKRSELLAKILNYKKSITVAGTHGKTTTTTMVANVFEGFKVDPTVINGGIINAYESNYKIGQGEFIIAEADESDGSFVNLPTNIGVITNIEPEHMEFYDNDFEKVLQYYRKYISNINDVAVVCLDDPEIIKIHSALKNEFNFITYGEHELADVRLKNFSQNIKGVFFDCILKKSGKIFKNLHLPCYGLHNTKNALASIAIAEFLSFDLEQLSCILQQYKGVQRRFTKIDNGDNFTIIDDYAHHPTEIIVTLKAAKALVPNDNLIVVFQPHKYNRVESLLNEFVHSFNQADLVVILDIYEPDLIQKGELNRVMIAEEIKKTGHVNVISLGNDEVKKFLYQQAKKTDLVVFVGAGSISAIARSSIN